jgi:hypothetical protein
MPERYSQEIEIDYSAVGGWKKAYVIGIRWLAVLAAFALAGWMFYAGYDAFTKNQTSFLASATIFSVEQHQETEHYYVHVNDKRVRRERTVTVCNAVFFFSGGAKITEGIPCNLYGELSALKGSALTVRLSDYNQSVVGVFLAGEEKKLGPSQLEKNAWGGVLFGVLLVLFGTAIMVFMASRKTFVINLQKPKPNYGKSLLGFLFELLAGFGVPAAYVLLGGEINDLFKLFAVLWTGIILLHSTFQVEAMAVAQSLERKRPEGG